MKSMSGRLPATALGVANDKRVTVEGKFEMSGMRKAADRWVSGSAAEPRRRGGVSS